MGKFWFLISIAGLIGSTAAAQYGVAKHGIYGAVGMSEGGFALGADYENMGFRDYGIGGFVRMYQKDDDRKLGDREGIVSFGGFIRPHFNKKSWDFYVSPGFGIISIDSYRNDPDDTTTLGPSLGLGLLYDLGSSVSLGIENMKTWVWFDDDWRGLRIDDFMFRFKVAF